MQQGRSSEGNDQFFFLTSAQSPAMHTTQQHAHGLATTIIPSGQALNTSHSWHQCSTVHGGLFSAFNSPTNDTSITYFNRAILPLYIFEEAPNVLQSIPLYSGETNLIAFQNSWRMYQIKRKYSDADVPKSTKGHSGSFYDSNFRQVEPSKSGLMHGQRLSPASTYSASQAWSKTYQMCGAGTANHWTTWYSNLP